MPPAEVISRYHDLWQVERSFRMSKTDLAARPVLVRRRDAIEAHLTIVFTALAVARETQDRTGLAIRNVIRQLRPLRSATIAVNGAVQAFPPAIGPEQQQDPRRPQEQAGPPWFRVRRNQAAWPRWSCCRSSGQPCCSLRDAVGADAGQGRGRARPGCSRRTTTDHGYSRRVVLGRASASALRSSRLSPSLVDRCRQSGKMADLRH